MKTFPILQSQRLLLRQFKETDLADVFKGLSNPAVIQYYGISFDSLEATKNQMAWFADLEKNGTGIWWAVCSKKTQTFLDEQVPVKVVKSSIAFKTSVNDRLIEYTIDFEEAFDYINNIR